MAALSLTRNRVGVRGWPDAHTFHPQPERSLPDAPDTIVFSGDGEPRPDALVRDPKAVELISQLDHDFSGVQRLKGEQVNFLLRMKEFDRLAWAFLAEHPDGVIVDLGCGLDTRFGSVWTIAETNADR